MILGRGLALLAALLTIVTVRADYDHDDIKRLKDAGRILPLETIIEQFRQHYPAGRILEAELEFEAGVYIYELEILQENGTVLELEYDAHSGELWRIEHED